MADLPDREFDLHVWKKCGDDGEADVYIIGVWDGDQIRTLCHIEPLESALATVRRTLENAGKPTPIPQF
jgi:hypothetical protein